MRSIAAEGSAGDGGVVATVNGYGDLVAMRIAPEMLADVPRLQESVKRAVNRAKAEARRQAPPPPLPRLGPVPASSMCSICQWRLPRVPMTEETVHFGPDPRGHRVDVGLP